MEEKPSAQAPPEGAQPELSQIQTEGWLTVLEAALRFKRQPASVNELCRLRKIEAIKVSSEKKVPKYLINPESAQAYFKRIEQKFSSSSPEALRENPPKPPRKPRKPKEPEGKELEKIAPEEPSQTTITVTKPEVKMEEEKPKIRIGLPTLWSI